MKHRSLKKGIYQPATHLAAVLFLLIIFVSVAYFYFVPGETSNSEQEDLLAELQTNRQRWEENRPPSYQYVVERGCFCAPPFTKPYVATEQRGDRSAAYPFYDPSEPGDSGPTPESPHWIDDIFEITEAALNDGAEVGVSYNARFGFPASVSISRPVPDGGQQFEVRDFEVLEYD